MPEAFKLQQILYSDESSFAANSGTMTAKIPFISATVTLDHPRIDDPSMRERLAVWNDSHKGVRTATLETTHYVTGQGGSGAGAMDVLHWLSDLLGDGLGGRDTATVGANGGVGATGLTTTSIGTDHTATIYRGSVIRVGDKGDGRADGQAAVVGNQSTAGTLVTALPAAPNNGDNVYGAIMAYHSESAVTSLTTRRFLVMHATTGAQYRLLGGQLAGYSITIPFDGSLPTVTITHRFAYWERSATTYPETATSLGTHECAPCAGGSVFYTDVGSEGTRGTITPASMTLTTNLELSPLLGEGGANTYQNVTAWARTGCQSTLEVVVPWATSYETLWDLGNPALVGQAILFTSNAVDGRSWGFFAPNARITGNRPSGVTEANMQNYVTARFNLSEGSDTTNEMTRSALRLWFA